MFHRASIEALYAMREADIATPAILLTTFYDDEFVLRGMRAGAKGVLLKDVTLENLVKAIETVHQGETYVQPVVTEKILKGLANLDMGSAEIPERKIYRKRSSMYSASWPAVTATERLPRASTNPRAR